MTVSRLACRFRTWYADAVHRARDWYDRNVLVIIGGILAVTAASLVIGVIGTYTNMRQDAEARAENRTRDKETARLLECFDDYAAATSSSSSAVRKASINKDHATEEAWRALNREGQAFLNLVTKINDGSASKADLKDLGDSLADRAAAGKRLERAQDNLDRARAENPVPPPPSVFCARTD